MNKLKQKVKMQEEVIKLMANQLSTPIHSAEWIIQYYYKLLNDINNKKK